MSSFDKQKATALISYIASASNIGKTKLMKLLYLMDFTMYARTRKSITNSEYRHWSYGPVPIEIWKLITTEAINDSLNVEEIQTTGGVYKKYTPKEEEIDMSIFNEEEKIVIYETLEKFGDKLQEDLVKKVHEELPYRITYENEPIPYFLATYRDYNKIEELKLSKKIKTNKKLMKKVKDEFKRSLSLLKYGIPKLAA